jgi:hypothetical protein
VFLGIAVDGGGERLGAAPGESWRREMAACLLVHPSPCSLCFLQSKDTSRNANSFFFLKGKEFIREHIFSCVKYELLPNTFQYENHPL